MVEGCSILLHFLDMLIILDVVHAVAAVTNCSTLSWLLKYRKDVGGYL
uniref:Uncharacterized protein n=1 Tax=Arundo donax TaxID=35708 RepID=A0A0A9F844_ARUDO